MTSIFDDQELFNALKKAAIDHDRKFSKEAQLAADPNVNEEYRNYLNLANKLVDNLKTQLARPASPISGAAKEMPLNVQDLSSIGDFLGHIVKNNISIGGKPVAILSNQAPADNQSYIKITGTDYLVDKQLLTQYIQHLNEQIFKLPEETKLVAKNLLGNVLSQINQELKTTFSTNYQPPAPVVDKKVVDTTKPSTDNKPQQPNTQQLSEGKEAQVIQQLVGMHPFNSQRIDFEEIENFAQTYLTLEPSVAPLVQNIENAIKGAIQFLGGSKAPIIIDNLTPEQIKDWAPTQPLTLINALISIIQNAGRLYADFYQRKRNTLENWANQRGQSWASDALRKMEQQITSGGPEQTNMGDLANVKSQIMRTLQH